MNLREQWRALSVHERYQVAMFVVLWGIPAVAMVVLLLVMIAQVIA